MHNILTKMVLAVVVLFGLQVQMRAVDVDDFEDRLYKDAQGNTIPYRLFVPKDYDPQQKYPLVLFMHGAGERGDDNRAHIMGVAGLGARVWADEKTQAANPTFVIAPQVPRGEQWVDIPFSMGSHEQPKQPTESMRLTLEILEALQEEFSIDPQRLYVTGLSMGGYGTWDIITRHPEMFAAAVPIAGGGDPSKAPLIADLPIWAFHGARDNVVPVSGSRDMIEALKEAGGEPLYTEYPDAMHVVWDRAYLDPDLLPWVFAQARPEVRQQIQKARQ